MALLEAHTFSSEKCSQDSQNAQPLSAAWSDPRPSTGDEMHMQVAPYANKEVLTMSWNVSQQSSHHGNERSRTRQTLWLQSQKAAWRQLMLISPRGRNNIEREASACSWGKADGQPLPGPHAGSHRAPGRAPHRFCAPTLRRLAQAPRHPSSVYVSLKTEHGVNVHSKMEF